MKRRNDKLDCKRRLWCNLIKFRKFQFNITMRCGRIHLNKVLDTKLCFSNLVGIFIRLSSIFLVGLNYVRYSLMININCLCCFDFEFSETFQLSFWTDTRLDDLATLVILFFVFSLIELDVSRVMLIFYWFSIFPRQSLSWARLEKGKRV